MNQTNSHVYEELRTTEAEIKNVLKREDLEAWFSKLLFEELRDVESSIEKMSCGQYGKCEVSGELLPEMILKAIPTLRSQKDIQQLGDYCRKSFNESFIVQ